MEIHSLFFHFYIYLVSPLNYNLGGLRFGVDGDGNYGYYGADDSLIPFKKGFASFTLLDEKGSTDSSHALTYKATKKCTLLCLAMAFSSYGGTHTSSITSTGNIIDVKTITDEKIGTATGKCQISVAIVDLNIDDTVTLNAYGYNGGMAKTLVFEML